MTTTRSTTVTWLALVALTVASFTLGHAAAVRTAPALLLLAALLKAWLVGAEFMELRAAHVAWRAAFGAVLGILVVSLLAIGTASPGPR